MLGKHLDLTEGESAPRPPAESAPAGRRHTTGPSSHAPFIGVHFACCRTYGRIYLQTDRSAYYGHCPRCGRRIEVVRAPAGSDSRFFSAY